jgi:hypothetical protein
MVERWCRGGLLSKMFLKALEIFAHVPMPATKATKATKPVRTAKGVTLVA